MHIKINASSECCGCEACYCACPKSCIKMEMRQDGFYYPIVDDSECINCGKCTKVCPVINGGVKRTPISTFEGYTKNASVRKSSSSGGIFTELASIVISEKGKVYGAAFDENFLLKETGVDSLNNLELLRGSKYVQSRMGTSYQGIRKELSEGRTVLCSGTPCQILALNNYLGKEYDNLFTVDFACHGVPSQILLEKYIRYIENKERKKISCISFRDKTLSWEKYGMKICFDDETVLTIPNYKDKFLKLYLSDICLRSSCYSCPSKNFSSGSDITLGDCWRIAFSDKNDHLGTSVAFANTEKGYLLLNRITDCIHFTNVDYLTGVKSSLSLISSTKKNNRNEDFMKEYMNLEFNEISKKYLPNAIETLFSRVIKKMSRI